MSNQTSSEGGNKATWTHFTSLVSQGKMEEICKGFIPASTKKMTTCGNHYSIDLHGLLVLFPPSSSF